MRVSGFPLARPRPSGHIASLARPRVACASRRWRWRRSAGCCRAGALKAPTKAPATPRRRCSRSGRRAVGSSAVGSQLGEAVWSGRRWRWFVLIYFSNPFWWVLKKHEKKPGRFADFETNPAGSVAFCAAFGSTRATYIKS